MKIGKFFTNLLFNIKLFWHSLFYGMKVADEKTMGVNVTYKYEIENVPVYHYKDLHAKFPKGVKMAILALPGNIAQSVADELMALGVTAFINFSDGALKTRRRVIVESVDLATIVQEVIYKFKQVNG